MNEQDSEVSLGDVYEAVRTLTKQVEDLDARVYELTTKVDAGKREEHTHHHYGPPSTYHPPPPSDWRSW